jgi:hypothetical protein
MNKSSNDNITHIIFKHMTEDNRMTLIKRDAVNENDFIGYKFSHTSKNIEYWLKDI